MQSPFKPSGAFFFVKQLIYWKVYNAMFLICHAVKENMSQELLLLHRRASPQFPRLLKADAIRETISKGVNSGLLAYVDKAGNEEYKPFPYNTGLNSRDVEISDDMFIITREVAESYKSAKENPEILHPPISEISGEEFFLNVRKVV
jgi:hypothetical protein